VAEAFSQIKKVVYWEKDAYGKTVEFTQPLLSKVKPTQQRLIIFRFRGHSWTIVNDLCLTTLERVRDILAAQKISLAQQKLDMVAEQAQLEVQTFYKQGFEKAKRRLFREAIIDFGQAIRRDPNFVKAYIARGYAQVLIDEKESAVKDFQMVEKIYIKRKEISYPFTGFSSIERDNNPKF
jgi:tetratricopeptide (TPR) repeat protein